MNLYAKVRILAVEENSFKNNEGVEIRFCKNYLKGDDGAVIELNSGKLNLSSMEGKEGVGTFEARMVNDKWQLKLRDFAEGEELEVPEGTIE